MEWMDWKETDLMDWKEGRKGMNGMEWNWNQWNGMDRTGPTNGPEQAANGKPVYRNKDTFELPCLYLERKIVFLQDLAAHISKDITAPDCFTNGCFDILHRGYWHLFGTKALGASLVVGVNSRCISTQIG